MDIAENLEEVVRGICGNCLTFYKTQLSKYALKADITNEQFEQICSDIFEQCILAVSGSIEVSKSDVGQLVNQRLDQLEFDMKQVADLFITNYKSKKITLCSKGNGDLLENISKNEIHQREPSSFLAIVDGSVQGSEKYILAALTDNTLLKIVAK